MTAAITKPKFIDFQALKLKIKIEEAMPLLGLRPAQFSDQMRSPCPACKSGGARALVITASKNVFYCFASGQGGDVISLTAHIRGISMKEAATFLAEQFQKEPQPKPIPTVTTVPSNSSPKKNEAGQPTGLNPLTYLQPEHPLVQALGISPETCRHFGAGYAPKGIMRGRLAIPIHDDTGVLVAYCGQVLKKEHVAGIKLPREFDAQSYLFNAHALRADETIFILKSPYAVMKAFENGVENAICFLGNALTSHRFRQVAELSEKLGAEDFEYR